MLADNFATTSFSAALQRTFDGKHPCRLCKVIAAGKKSEKKADTVLRLKKFEGLSQPAAIALPPPASFSLAEAPNPFLEARSLAPPTPPPRAA